MKKKTANKIVPIADTSRHPFLTAEELFDQVCYYGLAQTECLRRLKAVDSIVGILNAFPIDPTGEHL